MSDRKGYARAIFDPVIEALLGLDGQIAGAESFQHCNRIADALNDDEAFAYLW